MVTSRTPLSRKRRYLRLFAFTIVATLIAYILVNTALAWQFVNALTKPACQHSPRSIEGLPPPTEFWLHTNDGHKLRFWYYPPKNGAVVIMLGGLGGSLGSNLPPADFLLAEGFGVLQIDSRACADPLALVTLGQTEVLDAAAGLQFLANQPDVNRIGAMGFSMGGVTAIRTAAHHSEILSVIAEGGYYNLGDHVIKPDIPSSLPRLFFLNSIAVLYWLQTGVNPWSISLIDDLPAINPRPVLLIYGEHELTAGRGDLQYAAAQEPKDLWIVPGGNHGTNHIAAPQEYRTRVMDFFRLTLTEP